jgi:hypothetical protein
VTNALPYDTSLLNNAVKSLQVFILKNDNSFFDEKERENWHFQ